MMMEDDGDEADNPNSSQAAVAGALSWLAEVIREAVEAEIKDGPLSDRPLVAMTRQHFLWLADRRVK